LTIYYFLSFICIFLFEITFFFGIKAISIIDAQIGKIFIMSKLFVVKFNELYLQVFVYLIISALFRALSLLSFKQSFQLILLFFIFLCFSLLKLAIFHFLSFLFCPQALIYHVPALLEVVFFHFTIFVPLPFILIFFV
jgi:hypothetical protein